MLLCCIAAVPAAAEEPTVSIMFVQDDLRDAVTELILQTGVNILLDDSVYGVVTLDLVDVPLEQALRMMALPGGYGSVQTGRLLLHRVCKSGEPVVPASSRRKRIT